MSLLKLRRVVASVAAEDRCHLNGLVLAGGLPRYVTALAETDTAEGWRPVKAEAGCVIDVPQNRVLARGLSMPHSPRLHDGRLWVLESGTGRVLTLDPVGGGRQTVAELPGFTRGLAFHGRYAFVGLSKVRETATFGGLPIAERLGELRCGVWVVDVRTGEMVERMQFDAGVEEIFSVQVLAGVRFPEIVGFQQDTIQGAFVVPP